MPSCKPANEGPAQFLWLVGLPVVLTGILLLAWRLGSRPKAEEEEDPSVTRARALALLDAKLSDLREWRNNPHYGSDFDQWFWNLRSEIRPHFGVISVDFDSWMVPILFEFSAQSEDLGPMRDYSRQLTLATLADLLEEEKNRLEGYSGEPQKQPEKLLRIPLPMLKNGW